MLKLGIDPPHGIACTQDGAIHWTKSCKDLAELFCHLRYTFKTHLVDEVVIEQPFGLGSHLGRGMPVNVQRKISANIGQVYQSAIAIQAFCESYGIKTRLQHPNKWVIKMKAKKFQQLTGYTKRCNEHERDAAMLIFERHV